MPYKTYQATNSRRSARKVEDTPEEYTQEEINNDSEMTDATENEENGTADKKKPWLQRTKEGGVKKLPKEVQKRRRNYRLKKMLTPKAPLMVLHELLNQTPITYEVDEPAPGQPVMRNTPALYTARTTYDGETFSGMGPSKSLAKNVCAESVLQYIVTKSCKGEEEEGKENKEAADPKRQETETPWVSLASLALFKMFNDWQSQGFQVPIDMIKGPALGQPATGTNGDTEKEKSPKKAAAAAPKVDKALPENPTEKHPVQLLNEMAGTLTYVQEGGEQPHTLGKLFHLTVCVNGRNFTGSGKNKKDAKKAAAMAALKALWGVVYPVKMET